MYNAWFGDCFQIQNGSSNLFVDFGVHHGSRIRYPLNRKLVHKIIADDIEKGSKNRSLLITHYHDDHLSGLVYMMQQHKLRFFKYNRLFETVYIPNIWGVSGASNIVLLHLLEELIRRYKVKSNISLLDFVEFLCGSTYKVVFSHRGTVMEDEKYIALWPDPEIVGDIARGFLDEFSIINNSPIFSTLLEISNGLCEIVAEIAGGKELYGSQDSHVYIQRIEEIRIQLNSLQENRVIQEWSNNDTLVSSLNSFGNKISIVFHNKENGKYENLLFTGDIESKYMDMIAQNYDKNKECAMHDTYCYVKIPHHGTDKYFYDFSKYNPKVFMIPNGSCYTWKISKDYIQDGTNGNNAKVYCSNCNWCEGNIKLRKFTCPCVNHEIIFPYLNLKVIP